MFTNFFFTSQKGTGDGMGFNHLISAGKTFLRAQITNLFSFGIKNSCQINPILQEFFLYNAGSQINVPLHCGNEREEEIKALYNHPRTH